MGGILRRCRLQAGREGKNTGKGKGPSKGTGKGQSAKQWSLSQDRLSIPHEDGEDEDTCVEAT